MALNLILVRHAKSDWDNDLRDYERPLNKRGEKNAEMMGKILAEKIPNIDLIICSSAVRTYITASIFAKELNYTKSIISDRNLYNTGIPELLNALRTRTGDSKTVVIFSHNPGISYLAHYLCNNFTESMPTASVVHLEIPVDSWNMITQNSAMLVDYLYPKMF